MTLRAIEWPWSQTSFRKVPEKIIMTYVVVFWFVYLLLLLFFRRNQLFITFALFKTLNEIITLFTLPAALTANSSRVHIGVIKVSASTLRTCTVLNSSSKPVPAHFFGMTLLLCHENLSLVVVLLVIDTPVSVGLMPAIERMPDSLGFTHGNRSCKRAPCGLLLYSPSADYLGAVQSHIRPADIWPLNP